MTVAYHRDIRSGLLNGFALLLFRWKGSVYKLIYRELLCFLIAYALVRVIYKSALDEHQKTTFELVSLHCARSIDWVPLPFVLAFYISMVVDGWWTQFTSLPIPDRILNTLVMYVEGDDERGHLLRRNLMRYWNLLFILLVQSTSQAVKDRFPKIRDLVQAGYMTEEEWRIYESIPTTPVKRLTPMIWFLDLLNKARIEGRIKSDIAIKHIIEELNDTRSKLGVVWHHDWVPLPLVYTQVVTWAVYLFFIISVFGRQYLDPAKNYDGHEIDLYVPIFTIIQFVFYMGWLKVAESLFNPFGNDEDDIELNWILDRHLVVSYLWLDELQGQCPTELKPFGFQSTDGQRSMAAKSGPVKKNAMQILTKRNEVLSKDDLVKLNAGTWRFSDDQEHGIRQKTYGWSGWKNCFTRP